MVSDRIGTGVRQRRNPHQKLDVPRDLKTARSVGLKIILLPQSVDRALADLLGSRHRPAAPVSRTFWFGLQRGRDYGGHLLLIVEGLTTSTRLYFPDAVQSLGLEALAPQCGSMAIDVQFIGNFPILRTSGSH